MTHALSDYELLRQERIKRNNERLASLGLHKFKCTPPSTPKKKTKAVSSSKFVSHSRTRSRRSSRRLKNKPVLYQPLEFTNAASDEKIVGMNKKSPSRKMTPKSSSTLFRCETPMDVSSSPLTSNEKALVTKKTNGKFLEKFEKYLQEIDVLSEQNRRNVMRQITKLSNGEGIRYESKAYGWPDGCYFMKGVAICPTDDILKLMDLGRECEQKWGRDRGNGWLLSHPLKKLYAFQQFCLEKEV